LIFTVNASLLDAIVLSVVSENDTYGYKITQEVNNIIGISESTLYPVLRRLQKDNNLEVYDMEYLGRNRRYYKITNKGRILLSLYKEEWEMYKEKIDKVFEKDFKPGGKNKESKNISITEFIDSLKINEKIENLKLAEKIESLKIDEKIELLKTEGLKLGKKLDDLINSKTSPKKNSQENKNTNEDTNEDSDAGDNSGE
jgi:PadR family transcriptional regulator PadR